jgi:hypothetical protein
MTTQIILYTALVVHLIALAISIGITLANAIACLQFWKLYDKDKAQGLAGFRAIAKFQLFGIIGLSTQILTGLIILWVFKWTLVELLWFKIKLFMVVLLFVNGFTLGRTTSLKLQKLFSANIQTDKPESETGKLKRNILIFQVIQLSIFIIIITLSVFKFS